MCLKVIDGFRPAGPLRSRASAFHPTAERHALSRHRTGISLRCGQFTSVRFTERLEEIGARPSIGTVADSSDNALAETINGLYKAECV
jgi:transposase InsO family protein